MFGSRKTLSMVTTASLIALGALLTWYAVLFPPAQYIEGRKARSRLYEQVTVLSDGTPLLALSRAGMPAAEYRDLQGEIVARGPTPPAPNLSGPQSAQPQVPELPHPIAAGVSLPVEVAQSRSWSRRIMGLSDRPGTLEGLSTLWYFIRGPQNQGGGYFEGYDERTRQLVGFIGAEGYQAGRPVGDQRFVLGEGFDANRIATTQYAYFGSPTQDYYWNYGGSIPGSPERVYMALPDRLIQVDLSRRTVRTFAEIANVIAIAISTSTTGDDAEEQLYVRTPENIMVLDAEGSVSQQIPVPSDIQKDNLVVYRLSSEGVVMDAIRNYYNHNLLWVSGDGSVARREAVTLGIMAGDPFGDSPTMIALFAPGPLAMAGAMVIDATQIQRAKGESVSQSLATAVARSAAPALMHLVLSALLVWLVYRRDKSVGQQAVGWAVFVFLLGIPGVIGYLFHRERSARIPCERCQKPVLRSRSECSSCGEPFPLPGRLGTEVFA